MKQSPRTSCCEPESRRRHLDVSKPEFFIPLFPPMNHHTPRKKQQKNRRLHWHKHSRPKQHGSAHQTENDGHGEPGFIRSSQRRLAETENYQTYNGEEEEGVFGHAWIVSGRKREGEGGRTNECEECAETACEDVGGGY